MTRAVLVLANDTIRNKAADWVRRAPKDTRLTFQGPRRTIPQNDRMWAMLTEISRQLVWFGAKYSPDDWKDHMMHMYKGARFMPGEDGGVVPIGRSTSDLSKEEHSELTTLIEAFAARHGVTFHWEQ